MLLFSKKMDAFLFQKIGFDYQNQGQIFFCKDLLIDDLHLKNKLVDISEYFLEFL